MYSDIVMDHFANPRNVGKMTLADGIGVVGDVRCGDQLTFYIKINNGAIEDIKFLVFGCAAAIATSSMTTELVKGKTIEEALKLKEQDIIDALDGLPPLKYHCSVLGVEALHAAVKDYELKKNMSLFKKIQLSVARSISDNREKLIHHMMMRFHGK